MTKFAIQSIDLYTIKKLIQPKQGSTREGDQLGRTLSAFNVFLSLQMGPKDTLSQTEFVDWATKHAPYIFNGIHRFLLIKLSGASFDDSGWHRRMSAVS